MLRFVGPVSSQSPQRSSECALKIVLEQASALVTVPKRVPLSQSPGDLYCLTVCVQGVS